MRYMRLSDLPEILKDNLPRHAQEVYRAAFNSAWEQYKTSGEGDYERETVAHETAWSAVKAEYEKRDGRWIQTDCREKVV